MIPDYIKPYCKKPNGVIIDCSHFMDPDCPESCSYAISIMGETALGIGAMDSELIKKIQEVQDK